MTPTTHSNVNMSGTPASYLGQPSSSGGVGSAATSSSSNAASHSMQDPPVRRIPVERAAFRRYVLLDGQNVFWKPVPSKGDGWAKQPLLHCIDYGMGEPAEWTNAAHLRYMGSSVSRYHPNFQDYPREKRSLYREMVCRELASFGQAFCPEPLKFSPLNALEELQRLARSGVYSPSELFVAVKQLHMKDVGGSGSFGRNGNQNGGGGTVDGGKGGATGSDAATGNPPIRIQKRDALRLYHECEVAMQICVEMKRLGQPLVDPSSPSMARVFQYAHLREAWNRLLGEGVIEAHPDTSRVALPWARHATNVTPTTTTTTTSTSKAGGGASSMSGKRPAVSSHPTTSSPPPPHHQAKKLRVEKDANHPVHALPPSPDSEMSEIQKCMVARQKAVRRRMAAMQRLMSKPARACGSYAEMCLRHMGGVEFISISSTDELRSRWREDAFLGARILTVSRHASFSLELPHRSLVRLVRPCSPFAKHEVFQIASSYGNAPNAHVRRKLSAYRYSAVIRSSSSSSFSSNANAISQSASSSVSSSSRKEKVATTTTTTTTTERPSSAAVGDGGSSHVKDEVASNVTTLSDGSQHVITKVECDAYNLFQHITSAATCRPEALGVTDVDGRECIISERDYDAIVIFAPVHPYFIYRARALCRRVQVVWLTNSSDTTSDFPSRMAKTRSLEDLLHIKGQCGCPASPYCDGTMN